MLSGVARRLGPVSLRLGHGAAGYEATRFVSAAVTQNASKYEGEVPLGVGSAFKRTRKFTEQEVADFLKLTGDTNPIHTSEEAASTRGLPGPVLPGIMLASLFPAIVGSNFPNSLYMTQSLTFRSPAPVNSTLTATVTVTKVSGTKVRFDTQCHTAGGALLVDGMAVCVMPRSDGGVEALPARDESFWGTRYSLSDV